MDKYRVLIVEDDAVMRKTYSEILHEEFEGASARNGLDALDMLDVVEPDILIVDGVMPVMDGWAFVKELRSHPPHETSLVIFISEAGDIGHIKDGYEKGVDIYLVKPMDPKRIVRLIHDQVKEKKLDPRPKKFTLPLLRENLKRLIHEHHPETAKTAHKVTDPGTPHIPERPKVLIVDDDPEIRRIVEIHLRDENDLEFASDGIAAINLLRRWKPDVIFLDWMMPRGNGFQLIKMLRDSRGFDHTRIIIISAKDLDAVRSKLDEYHISAILNKPFNPAALSKLIHKSLQTGMHPPGVDPTTEHQLRGDHWMH